MHAVHMIFRWNFTMWMCVILGAEHFRIQYAVRCAHTSEIGEKKVELLPRMLLHNKHVYFWKTFFRFAWNGKNGEILCWQLNVLHLLPLCKQQQHPKEDDGDLIAYRLFSVAARKQLHENGVAYFLHRFGSASSVLTYICMDANHEKGTKQMIAVIDKF